MIFTGDASGTVGWGLSHGMIVPTGSASGIEWDYNVTTPGETTVRGVLFYPAWAVEYGLDPNGNGARTEDPDFDGMDNLLEYALGGNPTNDDKAIIHPTSIFTASDIEYVYRRRTDADTRGLTYDLVLNTNGLESAFGNVSNSFETAVGTIDADFESVTNVIPAGIDLGFVNLEVTEQ